MILITEISKQEVRQLVEIAYRDDNKLLGKFHVEKFELEQAVESTMEMVNVTEEALELKFLKVEFNEQPIGYVITSGNHLYSFGISIKYRTKEILSEWWDLVKEILGEKFTCLLFSNNTRAIEYLKRRGMKIEWQNTEHEKLNEVLLTY